MKEKNADVIEPDYIRLRKRKEQHKISHLRFFAGIFTWLGMGYIGETYFPEGLWLFFGILGFALMILIIYFYEVKALIRRIRRL